MKMQNKNIYSALLILIMLFVSAGIYAQTDIELNDVVMGQAEVSASHSITLKPGFKANEGSCNGTIMSATSFIFIILSKASLASK